MTDPLKIIADSLLDWQCAAEVEADGGRPAPEVEDAVADLIRELAENGWTLTPTDPA